MRAAIATEDALRIAPPESSAAAPALGERRVAELDGLRGVAVLLVILCHYVSNVLPRGEHPALRSTMSWTWSGVDLFFVLSGFLIGGILLAQRESPRYYRTFYLRRACRIIPIYVVVVGVAFAFTELAQRGLVPAAPFRKLLPAWTYLTFTQNLFMAYYDAFGSQFLSPTWSLAVEEQFYLLVPLLVRLVPPRRLPLLLVAGILAAPVMRLWFGIRADGTPPLAVYVLMPARADALLLGVLAAWAWRDEGFRNFFRDAGAWVLVPVASCAAAVAVLARGGGDQLTPEMAHGGYSWLALGYAFVVLAAAGPAPSLGLLRWGPLQGLGRVSYTTYLLHLPVLRIVHFALRGDFPSVTGATAQAVTVLAFVITVALAALSWRFFEGPIVRRGHRVRYRPDGETIPVPA
ncbi:MAG TPA: acyltransferase [Vicinamibacteria bacterium]|nr:acyltransferase [Vicinamibacteria bacterium]